MCRAVLMPWIDSFYRNRFRNRKPDHTGVLMSPSIAGMPPNTQNITLGPIRLEQRDGVLLAHHSALREPAHIDTMQLQRWLLKQLREQVVIVPAHSNVTSA